MAQSPPEGFSRITPYLLYEDLDAAVEWLVGSFGFVERIRMAGADGRALHAEIALGDAIVMMGNPGPHYKNPLHRGGATQLVYAYVDDVESHFEWAKNAGVQIIQELADQFYGDRTYGAQDPEGHQWSFAEHVRDVSPEDMYP